MAPSRRSQGQAQSKAQTRAQDRIAAVHSTARNRTTRSGLVPDSGGDVYRKLLTEASLPEIEERPLKRPRLGRTRQPDEAPSGQEEKSGPIDSDTASDREPNVPRLQQTTIDSEESDEDMDWEEVGFDSVEPQPSSSKKDEFGDISLEISTKKAQKKVINKRKPATTAEKLLRLEAHEAHLLFLLFHTHVRNAWCNLPNVQAKLKTILTPEIISLLHPDQSLIQFGRSEQFINGLQRAVLIWKAKFNVNASGIRRPVWTETSEGIKDQITAIQDEMVPISKDDFVKSAASLAGSQDIGSQLFCALLRCVGVEARLVCSLQPLPFGTSAKAATPRKGSKATVYMDDGKSNTSAGESSAGSASEGSSSSRRRIIAPGRIRRLGQPSLGGGPSTPSAARKKRTVRKLDYPVFWVEAFNAAYQKWVPVDAMVTGTVAKPSKLEPPASYEANILTYVVAFEDDGAARDITRRYTKAYNAKTRKLRVESTGNGELWWRKALKVFRRRTHLDRDMVEDAELAKKEAAEGLPSNVQDFKDHPYYALERHLKRHEIIWPKREVGKISAGKGSSSVESVFRRSDVQTVRSADKWYRFGREIKPGEQALKHVPARSQRGRAQILDDDEEEEQAATPLYAFSQTVLYVPPPVVNGRIPKNGYGNLDVYVPSMVPPGACHIRHSLAQKAARLIGIDYADAVTGFQFKGRHGTAVTSGVIVADEYREAVEGTIEGIEYAQENEDARIHGLECLRLWRHFLAGLRIKERLTEYTTTTSSNKNPEPEVLKEKMDEAENKEQEIPEAGGFFPEPDQQAAMPTANRFKAAENLESDEDDVLERARPVRRRRKVTADSDIESDPESEDNYQPSPRKAPIRRRRPILESPSADEETFDPEEGGGGGFIPSERDDDVGGGGVLPEADANHDSNQGGFIPDPGANDFGGGFMPEEDTSMSNKNDQGFVPEVNEGQEEYSGGGFIPEEDETEVESTSKAVDMEGIGQGGGFMPEESTIENTFDPDEMDLAVDITNHAAKSRPQTQADKQQDTDEAEDLDERGSLLSHDPEDEDAEPDWLYSD